MRKNEFSRPPIRGKSKTGGIKAASRSGVEVAPGGGDQAVRGKRDGDELKMRRGSSGTGMVDWQGQRGQMGSTEEERLTVVQAW